MATRANPLSSLRAVSKMKGLLTKAGGSVGGLGGSGAGSSGGASTEAVRLEAIVVVEEFRGVQTAQPYMDVTCGGRSLRGPYFELRVGGTGASSYAAVERGSDCQALRFGIRDANEPIILTLRDRSAPSAVQGQSLVALSKLHMGRASRGWFKMWAPKPRSHVSAGEVKLSITLLRPQAKDTPSRTHTAADDDAWRRRSGNAGVGAEQQAALAALAAAGSRSGMGISSSPSPSPAISNSRSLSHARTPGTPTVPNGASHANTAVFPEPSPALAGASPADAVDSGGSGQQRMAPVRPSRPLGVVPRRGSTRPSRKGSAAAQVPAIMPQAGSSQVLPLEQPQSQLLSRASVSTSSAPTLTPTTQAVESYATRICLDAYPVQPVDDAARSNARRLSRQWLPPRVRLLVGDGGIEVHAADDAASARNMLLRWPWSAMVEVHGELQSTNSSHMELFVLVLASNADGAGASSTAAVTGGVKLSFECDDGYAVAALAARLALLDGAALQLGPSAHAALRSGTGWEWNLTCHPSTDEWDATALGEAPDAVVLRASPRDGLEIQDMPTRRLLGRWAWQTVGPASAELQSADPTDMELLRVRGIACFEMDDAHAAAATLNATRWIDSDGSVTPQASVDGGLTQQADGSWALGVDPDADQDPNGLAGDDASKGAVQHSASANHLQPMPSQSPDRTFAVGDMVAATPRSRGGERIIGIVASALKRDNKYELSVPGLARPLRVEASEMAPFAPAEHQSSSEDEGAESGTEDAQVPGDRDATGNESSEPEDESKSEPKGLTTGGGKVNRSVSFVEPVVPSAKPREGGTVSATAPPLVVVKAGGDIDGAASSQAVVPLAAAAPSPDVLRLQERLSAFFAIHDAERHAPSSVAAMASVYLGKEQELNDLLRSEYGNDLSMLRRRRPTLQQRLIAFYAEHNPARVDTEREAGDTSIASVFEGDEITLNARLREQYGADLSSVKAARYQLKGDGASGGVLVSTVGTGTVAARKMSAPVATGAMVTAAQPARSHSVVTFALQPPKPSPSQATGVSEVEVRLHAGPSGYGFSLADSSVGVVVQEVKGAAAEALHVGDVLLQVGAVSTRDLPVARVEALVLRHPRREALVLRVRRDGEDNFTMQRDALPPRKASLLLRDAFASEDGQSTAATTTPPASESDLTRKPGPHVETDAAPTLQLPHPRPKPEARPEPEPKAHADTGSRAERESQAESNATSKAASPQPKEPQLPDAVAMTKALRLQHPPIAAEWASVAVAQSSSDPADPKEDGWSPRVIAVAADRVAVLNCRIAEGDDAPHHVEVERMLLLAGLTEIASLDLGSTGDTGDAVTQLVFRGGGRLEFVSSRAATIVRAVRGAAERVEKASDSMDQEGARDRRVPLATEGNAHEPATTMECETMRSMAGAGDALSQWLVRNHFEYIMPHLRNVGAQKPADLLELDAVELDAIKSSMKRLHGAKLDAALNDMRNARAAEFELGTEHCGGLELTLRAWITRLGAMALLPALEELGADKPSDLLQLGAAELDDLTLMLRSVPRAKFVRSISKLRERWQHRAEMEARAEQMREEARERKRLALEREAKERHAREEQERREREAREALEQAEVERREAEERVREEKLAREARDRLEREARETREREAREARERAERERRDRDEREHIAAVERERQAAAQREERMRRELELRAFRLRAEEEHAQQIRAQHERQMREMEEHAAREIGRLREHAREQGLLRSLDVQFGPGRLGVAFTWQERGGHVTVERVEGQAAALGVRIGDVLLAVDGAVVRPGVTEDELARLVIGDTAVRGAQGPVMKLERTVGVDDVNVKPSAGGADAPAQPTASLPASPLQLYQPPRAVQGATQSVRHIAQGREHRSRQTLSYDEESRMQPELESHDNDRGRLLQRAEQAAAHGNWRELEDAVSLLEYFELRHDAMVDDIVTGTLSEMIAQIEANEAREHVEECMGESQSVGAWLGETLQLSQLEVQNLRAELAVVKSERDDLARSLRRRTRRRGQSPAKAAKRECDETCEVQDDGTTALKDDRPREEQKMKLKQKDKEKQRKKEKQKKKHKEKKRARSEQQKHGAGGEQVLENAAVNNLPLLDEGESLQEDDILQFMRQQQRHG